MARILASFPAWTVVIPLAGAIMIEINGRYQQRRHGLAALASILTCGLVVGMLYLFSQGIILEYVIWELTPLLTLHFAVDPLGLLFAVVSSSLWVLAVFYSMGYMAHAEHQRRFFSFYILSLATTMGIAFAGDLFTLYLFYELLTLVTYPLVIHNQNQASFRAGRVYLFYSFLGATLVLIALLVTGGLTQTLKFSPGGILAPGIASSFTLTVLFFTFVAGFGVKAALMPLHPWLPGAMVAPTPVSALLHAVAVVNAGVFGLLRTMYSVFGPQLLADLGLGQTFTWIIAVTILLGSLIALQQDVLKKRLAYSTISQLGYITLGAGLAVEAGLTGGLLHIINHSLLKITLFFCAGTIITMTGKTRVSQLAGVGKRLPLTMGAFALAAVGMVGIIPMNGFVSKWFLLQGTLTAGRWELALLLFASAFLNAAYFFPLVYRAFFQAGDFAPSSGREAPSAMLIPILILAASSLALGLLPGLELGLVASVVEYLL